MAIKLIKPKTIDNFYNKNFLSLTILKYMADAVRQPSRRPDPNMRDTLRRDRGSRSRRLREKQPPITRFPMTDLRAM